MASAVTLVARNKSAKGVEELWDSAAVFEEQPSMRALNYPPHITFAKCDDTSGTELKKMLGRSFDRVKPLRIRFHQFHVHEASNIKLWTIPDKSDQLQRLFHSVQSHLDSALVRPDFHPGRWIPHCPLATCIPIDRREDVARFARSETPSVEVVFNAIEVVEFPPISVFKQWRLDV